MKLLVPVTRVLDFNVKDRVKADQSGVDLSNLKMSVNPFDEIALEEAVRLDAKTFVRPIYAANTLETVTTSDAKVLATIRPTVFAAAPEGGSASIETPDAGSASSTSRFLSADQVKSGRPELGSAKIVISGGRALGAEEEFKGVLEPLADRLGAAIGASRAAVDAGMPQTTIRWGRPARWWHPTSTSHSASPAPSSTWPGSRTPR
jgi:electron transfer flavoprotein alpha/beta subunit